MRTGDILLAFSLLE